MTPSLNSAQSIQEEGESNLAKFTNTEDVMYSLLCSLSVRGRVGLVCERQSFILRTQSQAPALANTLPS